MMPKNLTSIEEADETAENNKTQSVMIDQPVKNQEDPFNRSSPRTLMGMMDLSMESMGGFMRPTEAHAGNISRITQHRDISAFCDINDSKIMELLQDDNLFEDIDMGTIDDEERPFMLVDKDTGKVYDLRNDSHLSRVIDKSARITSDLSGSTSHMSAKPWDNWWKDRRRNNQEFLFAAENGNLDEV
jgi:hypothetical protein